MTTEQGGQAPSPALEQLIGKAVAEPDFRQQLIDDPEGAVRSAGIDLSQEELQAITGTSREEREQMLSSLGERTSPFCFWSSGGGSSTTVSCFWISSGGI
jgi:hypothetical protein